MTKEEIKPTVDEMIKNVLKYMYEALEDDEEFYELSIECAASFMTSDIDIDDNMEDIMNYLTDKHYYLFGVMIGGIYACKKNERDWTVL